MVVGDGTRHRQYLYMMVSVGTGKRNFTKIGRLRSEKKLPGNYF